MALFSKRHYEFLACWAGEHLTESQCGELAAKLKQDNAAFVLDRFIDACEKYRGLSINAWCERMANLSQGSLRMTETKQKQKP